MTLLTIAELLAGEAMISPGGVVDRLTATGEDVVIWQLAGAAAQPLTVPDFVATGA